MKLKLLDLLLFKCAHDSLCHYPEFVIKGKTKTNRTEWQMGFNAASIDISEKWNELEKWLESLPENKRYFIEHRLLESEITLRLREKGKILVINQVTGETEEMTYHEKNS